MLPVKSKYKIAKRLGPAVFEQTQSQKFALSESRARGTRGRRPRGQSDYGRQLLEKQRIRYTYGITEGQLSNYAQAASNEPNPSEALHRALELRADSVVYSAGFAPTRRAARQAISHGHFTVNGRRITTPSYRVRTGDVLAVREGNKRSPLYAGLAEQREERAKALPKWLDAELGTLSISVTGEPAYVPAEIGLDYPTLFEFYSR